MQKPIQATFDGVRDLKKYSLTEVEWSNLEKLKTILDPFKQATKMLSLEKYPNIASNTLIFQYLFEHCNELIEAHKPSQRGPRKKQGDQDWVSLGLTQAKSKLEQYCGDSDGKAYIIGTVLHPSYKLEWYKEAKGWFPEWIKKCNDVVLMEGNSKYHSSAPASQENSDEMHDFLERLYRNQMRNHIKADELQSYLSSPIIPRNEVAKFGVLDWWKNHETDFPNLARMARDYFSVGGSGVPAERFFSIGTDILSDNRQRLSAQHIKELMCLKYWYKILDN